MKINNKISLTIALAAMLHILGLAVYVFGFVPKEFHKMYFFNIDRIYILLLLACFHFIAVDKMMKLALRMSMLIYLTYFHIVNLKYIINFTYDISLFIWTAFTGISFVSVLTYIWYVSRR
jgi:hypothetical protein